MAGRYRFSLAEGHPAKHRAIGFLEEIIDEGDGESRIDAKVEFDSLGLSNLKKRRELDTRFDYWIDGGRNDKWFHGWPNDYDVKECFCFKWEHKKRTHRLYGFLFHPQSHTNPAFQICVLVYHDFKSDESTDRNLLLRSMALRTNPAVHAAIGFVFPDESTTAKGKIQ
jgi:hypothetical protein